MKGGGQHARNLDRLRKDWVQRITRGRLVGFACATKRRPPKSSALAALDLLVTER